MWGIKVHSPRWNFYSVLGVARAREDLPPERDPNDKGLGVRVHRRGEEIFEGLACEAPRREAEDSQDNAGEAKRWPHEVDTADEDGRLGVPVAMEGPGDNQVAAIKRIHIPPGTRSIPNHRERPQISEGDIALKTYRSSFFKLR